MWSVVPVEGRQGQGREGTLEGTGLPAGGWSGLTLHLLGEAVHVIGLIGVTDAIGPHTRKLILVSIAALPGSVDGVPVRNPKLGCDTAFDRVFSEYGAVPRFCSYW